MLSHAFEHSLFFYVSCLHSIFLLHTSLLDLLLFNFSMLHFYSHSSLFLILFFHSILLPHQSRFSSMNNLFLIFQVYLYFCYYKLVPFVHLPQLTMIYWFYFSCFLGVTSCSKQLISSSLSSSPIRVMLYLCASSFSGIFHSILIFSILGLYIFFITHHILYQ